MTARTRWIPLLAAVVLLFAAAVPGLAGCRGPERTVEQSLHERQTFRITVAALRLTGLDRAIAESDELVTLLAPNDAAWEATFSPAELAALLDEAAADELRTLMELHIVPGWHSLNQLAELRQVPTWGDETLAVTPSDGRIRIRGAIIVAADIAARNGVIHVLDRVLEPRKPRPLADLLVEQADTLGAFADALEATGLAERLRGPGPYTVFAPSNAAVARLQEPSWEALQRPENRPLLEAVLQHHMVDGLVREADLLEQPTLTTWAGSTLQVTLTEAETLRVNGASVVASDVVATNGRVHVLDAVLLPAVLPEPVTRTYEEATVWEALQQIDETQRFARAVEAAGLAESLDGEEPFTVIAAVDPAFEQLPEANALRRLTEADAAAAPGPRGAEMAAARARLAYHIVPGRYAAAELREQVVLRSVAGPALTVIGDAEHMRIDTAGVVRANMACRNGVLHLVDAVLAPVEPPPAAEPLYDTLQTAGLFFVLERLLEAAGLVERLTSADDEPLTLLAPTDDGFEALGGEAWVERMLEPENREALTALLQRHIVRGWLREEMLRDGLELTTLSGETLHIVQPDRDTLLAVVGSTESRLVQRGVIATNGIIHVLDVPLIERPIRPDDNGEDSEDSDAAANGTQGGDGAGRE